jgi:hypothetical protein
MTDMVVSFPADVYSLAKTFSRLIPGGHPILSDILASMMVRPPAERPTMRDVLSHPGLLPSFVNMRDRILPLLCPEERPLLKRTLEHLGVHCKPDTPSLAALNTAYAQHLSRKRTQRRRAKQKMLKA